MRVGLNLVALRDQKGTGIEVFSRNILGALRVSPEDSLLIALRSRTNTIEALGKDFFTANDNVSVSRWYVSRTVLRVPTEMLLMAIRMFAQDVVLSVNNFGPIFGRYRQRRIVVIHDIWFLEPNYNGSVVKRILFSFLLKTQLKFTHHVITVSDFSRREIVKHLGFESKRITVVQNCLVREKLATENCGRQTGRWIDSREEVRQKTFLLIGSDRPNKNILRAVSGYCQYVDDWEDSPSLVIVGDYSNKFIEVLTNDVPSHVVNRVVVRGFVPVLEYRSLMRQASGVVFPSLYEGFGIPVLEAISLGKPILITRGSVCEEIAGPLGIAVDTTDVNELASGYEQLLKKSVENGRVELTAHLSHYFDCPGAAKILWSCLTRAK